MKDIKSLGLVTLAAMAMMALLGTATASASSFTSNQVGKSITTTTVTQPVFTNTGSHVRCNVTKLEGVTEGTEAGGQFHSESQRMHPVVEGCEAFGFNSAISVNTVGCDYLFKSKTDANGMATAAIVDHPGETCNGIVITADPPFTTCTDIVPKQSIAGAVSYTNNSGVLRVKLTATGIEAIVNVSNGLCPLTTGVHSTANGNPATYNGETNVTAEGGVNWTA